MKEKSIHSLTVFTPTYNRGYRLPDLYESLKNQTVKDFVWLIVDDGSTDNTGKLLAEYQGEKHIDIQYYYQENSGKHVAHNKGVESCMTELFVCVDSDDILTKDAVEIILRHYREIKDEHILGMYLRKVGKDGNNLAPAYPKGLTYVGLVDLYSKWGFSGDTVIVLKTEMIKRYRFPVFPEEKFVTESVLYNQLNDIAPMALYEDAIYICEYLPDGYTTNWHMLMLRNPYGFAVAGLYGAFYAKGKIYKIKHYAQYLALRCIFKLDRKRLNICQKPDLMIRIGARLILPHYIKYVKKLKNWDDK